MWPPVCISDGLLNASVYLFIICSVCPGKKGGKNPGEHVVRRQRAVKWADAILAKAKEDRLYDLTAIFPKGSKKSLPISGSSMGRVPSTQSICTGGRSRKHHLMPMPSRSSLSWCSFLHCRCPPPLPQAPHAGDRTNLPAHFIDK